MIRPSIVLRPLLRLPTAASRSLRPHAPLPIPRLPLLRPISSSAPLSPPTSSSSSSPSPAPGPAASTSQTPGQSAALSGRLLIGFTCKPCSHRTHRLMSKQAYQRGVVIIKCEGCGSKHLIADHLGWFDSVGGRMGTIEEIMERAGREGEVRRVSFAEELHAEVESMEKGKVEVRRQFEGEIVDGGGRVGAKVEQKVEGETTLDKEKIKEIEALGEGLMEWLPKLADEAAAGDGVVNLSKRS